MSDSKSHTQHLECPEEDDVDAELRALDEDMKEEAERRRREEEERVRREEAKKKRREELLAEKKRREEEAARKKAEEEERLQKEREAAEKLRKEREDVERWEREERECQEMEEKEHKERAETEARERAESVAEEQGTGRKDKGKGKERGWPLSGSVEERPRPSKRPNLAQVVIDVDGICEPGPSRMGMDRMGGRVKMGGRNECGRCQKLGIECKVSEFRGRVACDYCERKKQACGFDEPECKEKRERKGWKGPTITIPSKAIMPGGMTHEQGQDIKMSLTRLINGQGMILRVLERMEQHLSALASGRVQGVASGSRSGWGDGTEWPGVEEKEGEGSSEGSEERSEGGEGSEEEGEEEKNRGMDVEM